MQPRNYFVYTPLLPAMCAGTVEERSIVEPVRAVLGTKVRGASMPCRCVHAAVLGCAGRAGLGKACDVDALCSCDLCCASNASWAGARVRPGGWVAGRAASRVHRAPVSIALHIRLYQLHALPARPTNRASFSRPSALTSCRSSARLWRASRVSDGWNSSGAVPLAGSPPGQPPAWLGLHAAPAGAAGTHTRTYRMRLPVARADPGPPTLPRPCRSACLQRTPASPRPASRLTTTTWWSAWGELAVQYAVPACLPLSLHHQRPLGSATSHLRKRCAAPSPSLGRHAAVGLSAPSHLSTLSSPRLLCVRSSVNNTFGIQGVQDHTMFFKVPLQPRNCCCCCHAWCRCRCHHASCHRFSQEPGGCSSPRPLPCFPASSAQPTDS